MAQPKLFIGSSRENLRVARVLADGLDADAEITVWNEGVFGLNRGPLENLLNGLDQFDFAVLVLAPDDITLSRDEIGPSTRDNVLFECGLFMGRLGRDRVFIVYDESISVKLPSDLAGVTVATYDWKRIQSQEPLAGVRRACRQIGDAIHRTVLSPIVGEWRSNYPLTIESGNPLAEEDVDLRSGPAGVWITNKNNSLRDYYLAQGTLVEGRFLIGKWKGIESSAGGAFLLTIKPRGTVMCGYSTGLDDGFGVVYAPWVLAKKDGASEDEICARLKQGAEFLKRITL